MINGHIKRSTQIVLMALSFLLSASVLPSRANAQSAQQIIEDAANALGGRDKVLAVKTLVLEGGGHDFEVDQGLRWDELGLRSDVSQIRDYKRLYDLANKRIRTEMVHQRQYAEFQGEGAIRQIQSLDGNVAFNVNENGNATRAFGQGQIEARRVDYLRHPLTLVRQALDPATKLSNVRAEGSERLVDVTIDKIMLTAAFDSTTKLPTRVMQMTDSATMGDRPVETTFTEYKSVDGLMLPSRFTTKIDRFVSVDILILRQAINTDVGDLAAPANLAAATPPAGFGPAAQASPATAQEIGKGVWFVTGTTHHSMLVEFSDHMMLIEAPNIERTMAVMAKAKELRPNKPVTVLLVTHHHSDHTSGVRTVVAMGVNEIITYKSNVEFLNEMFKRRHTINPDLYSKTAGAKPPKIVAVDDTGVVKDGTRTINLYHLLDNTHADSQLLIYFPQEQILTQADDYMPNDSRNIIPGEALGHAPWNQNVLANVNYRKLQVAYMAPIHGEYVPYSQFLENAILMTQYLPGASKADK